MDYNEINYLAHERMRDLRGERRNIEAYAFQPNLKKTLAASFYRLASKLEPKTFPPRKLA